MITDPNDSQLTPEQEQECIAKATDAMIRLFRRPYITETDLNNIFTVTPLSKEDKKKLEKDGEE